jgi:integrase/recombinase XerD
VKKEILDRFERHLEARNLKTRKDFLTTVEEFLFWCEKNGREFLSLSEEDAENWVLSLVENEKQLSRGTVNNKINRVKSFYLYLVKRGLVLNHPFYYLKNLKTGRQLPRDILKPDEMETLLSRFSGMRPSDVMLKTLMEILYGSALRISEAESLKLDDLHLQERIILITDHKNEKMRKVPVTEAAVKSICHYLASCREQVLSPSALSAGFLFPQGGKTYLRCRLNQRLKTECARLGLKTLTSHSFRHSAATHLLKNGAGIRQVQAYLGHESILSTQRYTHVEKEDLKAIISSCHPREAVNHG